MAQNLVYLSLGSNIGNRLDYLKNAIALIKSDLGVVSNVSNIYENDPWGFESENVFFNLCLELHTSHSVKKTLYKLKKIEKKVGRKKVLNSKEYQDRIIDIDILFYNNLSINKQRLIVPHPFIHKRRFVLQPLAEICADFIHPIFNKTIRTLLNECDDNSELSLFFEKADNYERVSV